MGSVVSHPRTATVVRAHPLSIPDSTPEPRELMKLESSRLLFPLACLALLGCPEENSGNDTSDTSTPTSGIDSISGTDTNGSTSDVPETATTGDTDSGSDTEAEGSTGEMMCGEAAYVLQAIPPNVMLVLDKSGSMVQNSWDADADPMTPDETRWLSLHNVVSFIVTTFDTEINFGANLFPSEAAIQSYSDLACLVDDTPEVPVMMMNAQGVLDGIPPADADGSDIAGATPATAGIQAALDHLKTLDPTVDRFMILVTDGAANCAAQYECPVGSSSCELFETYDTDLPAVVGSAFTDDSIPTFVVGIDIVDALQGEGVDGNPEANTFDELNIVAEAGGRARDGTEKFYNASNEIELQEALQEIAGQVVSCTIPLEPEPVHPNFVEIVVGGDVIPRVDDCETEDGWVFVNPEGPYDSITLCGTACEALAEAGELDANYGCPPPG